MDYNELLDLVEGGVRRNATTAGFLNDPDYGKFMLAFIAPDLDNAITWPKFEDEFLDKKSLLNTLLFWESSEPVPRESEFPNEYIDKIIRRLNPEILAQERGSVKTNLTKLLNLANQINQHRNRTTPKVQPARPVQQTQQQQQPPRSVQPPQPSSKPVQQPQQQQSSRPVQQTQQSKSQPPVQPTQVRPGNINVGYIPPSAGVVTDARAALRKPPSGRPSTGPSAASSSSGDPTQMTVKQRMEAAKKTFDKGKK